MSFAGIDWNQHGNWERITAPTGQNYYVIPGNPGYVYDPFLSAQRGRPVIFVNPSSQVQEKERIEKEAKKQRSPLNQALPIAGAVGGTVLANHAVDAFSPASAQERLAEQLLQGSGQQVAQGAAAAGQSTGAASQAFAQSAMGQGPSAPTVVGAERVGRPYPVATATDGNVVMSDGSIVPAQPGFSAGDFVQGGLGVVQGISAINAAQRGDYLGAGVYGAGAAANIGSAMGSELAASYIPGVNIAAGGYGAYQTAKYQSDAPSGGRRNTNSALGGAAAGASIGAGVGSILPGAGTLIGAGVGAVIGGLTGLAGSAFGSSKGERQMIRDKAREGLQTFEDQTNPGATILDKDYQGTLADGSKFDFGKDGKGLASLDYEDPTTGKIIAFSNVLTAGEGLYGKPQESVSHLYTAAALSNAKGDDKYGTAVQNMQHFARQRGFTLENVQGQLTTMRDQGLISDHQYQVYSNDARELFSAQPPAPAQKPQAPGKPVAQPPVQPQPQPNTAQPQQAPGNRLPTNPVNASTGAVWTNAPQQPQQAPVAKPTPEQQQAAARGLFQAKEAFMRGALGG